MRTPRNPQSLISGHPAPLNQNRMCTSSRPVIWEHVQLHMAHFSQYAYQETRWTVQPNATQNIRLEGRAITSYETTRTPIIQGQPEVGTGLIASFDQHRFQRKANPKHARTQQPTTPDEEQYPLWQQHVLADVASFIKHDQTPTRALQSPLLHYIIARCVETGGQYEINDPQIAYKPNDSTITITSRPRPRPQSLI